MKKYIAVLVIGLSSISVVSAGDIDNGQALSASCVACHGSDGVGKADSWPNIGGQKETYLISQLEQFKSGERVDSSMNAIVGPLSTQDIEDVAAYYASVSGSDASFSSETGVLAIPRLNVGDTSYKLQLDLTDPSDFTFKLDMDSIEIN